MSTSSPLNVTVAAIRPLTPLVREFTFTATDGSLLPRFSAGSHIQVHLPLGDSGRVLRNAYSLVSDPGDGSHYRIAVRRQEDSRGGSRFLHEQVQPGDRLGIGAPANLFAPHSRARHHILVAGGIGITPFMAYVQEFERRGDSFELHHACRTGLTDAYLKHLQQHLGDRFHSYDAEHGKPLRLEQLLHDRPLGTHVYCCGPQRLIDGVRDAARQQGWADTRVHFEAFAAPEPGVPFTAHLARSQCTVQVASDQSLLEALEAGGIGVPNLCRGGVCGQCATRFLDGAVEHRDHFLSSEERTHLLMPCVSRCGSDRPLLLDL
ncbi:Ferredoxin-NADP reductase [Lampropedia hyalina DSM 16112]|jgi:ferredoxin-NADP reductase|uniref:Ferredoxin-NADP reductase n=1 Tax=Lampropedia hyalina DSM 16112 TaxID=1122156 RepID=A0A1M4T6K2_9BURK|nr:PDR/VanB family oxidoreductase [Lampropedia hyalina]SHE40050.1 Ferredoxin-NADP reductase [Lampropedia hyalina DSM 16112]